MTDKQPEPEPEYIITERRVQELEKTGWWDYLVSEIRSRPYHPAPEQIPTCDEFIAEYVGLEKKKRELHDAEYRNEIERLNKLLESTHYPDGVWDRLHKSTAECERLKRESKEHDAAIRQSEREKSDKIFDHTITLCEALIERFDSQSQLGFNVLIIKRDIESLRKVE